MIGQAGPFDPSSPAQSDHLSLLIDKKIWWSTNIGRGWSGTPIFPHLETMNEILNIIYILIPVAEHRGVPAIVILFKLKNHSK